MDKKDLPGIIPAGQSNAFLRWQLPDFEGDSVNPVEQEAPPEEPPEEEPVAEVVEVEEVEIEQVPPITLEEVEAIRQEAYNEGFSTGEKDGFRAGQLKAQQEADAALSPRLQALESIMQQLFEPIAQQDQALEDSVLELVQHISQQVIQRELQLDSSHVRQVVSQALQLLPTEGDQIRIFVHPQDFDTIKALRERHEEKWRILEDDTLLPGGCRLETQFSRVDGTIETRIKTLSQQLLDQQRHLHTEPVAADDEQAFAFDAPPPADNPEPTPAPVALDDAQAMPEQAEPAEPVASEPKPEALADIPADTPDQP